MKLEGKGRNEIVIVKSNNEENCFPTLIIENYMSVDMFVRNFIKFAH